MINDLRLFNFLQELETKPALYPSNLGTGVQVANRFPEQQTNRPQIKDKFSTVSVKTLSLFGEEEKAQEIMQLIPPALP